MSAYTAGEAIHRSPFLLLTIGVYRSFFLPVIVAHFYSFKREAFRGSEYAGRILADNGIPVIMKVYLLLIGYHS